ncbi:sarcosine oxidase subunit gamma [Sulfitobacter guttiformis]|uniref:Sarcosine oxidase subunit gamma n=1 Tax=Sulfitobacter guttiformis TaxID=74349 RepID=A0A420DJC6_9RHOB|nr:sarcosine oxidase subunit gamma family protein [Sulfitobacter guttiformis]KIN71840.1 Sarcosine oxidase, gamma subunit family protein [Sulfitobacter guttiformis KCTC 32187]RKE94346.1 sarcosine oxidase subunit gamma [Sulfitobacter guttiformis]
MSDPVSALKNAAYYTGIAEIKEIGPMGMIALRGDLSAKPLHRAASAAAGGLNLPAQRECVSDGVRGIAWMSPDEMLIMCPYDEVGATIDGLNGKLGKSHTLVVNVSDARAVFEVRGAHAREVLAKLAPVDCAPDRFTAGMFRRTRIAQVPAAFWMPHEDVFRVVCFRSVAQYMLDVLSVAAQPGSEVGVF